MELSNVLETPVSLLGKANKASLSEVLSNDKTLLVFLRHAGCIFPSETIKAVKEASKAPRFPKVVFFFQGNQEQATAAFSNIWPEATVVADSKLEIFKGLGLKRGSPWQLFGPKVVSAACRAALSGNSIGMPTGDPLLMPALFLTENKEVTWTYKFRHAGDLPDFDSRPWEKLP